MRIKSLTVCGFRGFNEACSPIEFHDNLTLVSGANSYGKTSISESLEWLLFGVTSKVENADAKTEYKGSYRNCHFPESETPSVQVTFVGRDGSEVMYRGELIGDDGIRKILNGVEVPYWPWEQDAVLDPRPFVLQHSLKDLLLTTPGNRYAGFTRMIGAQELNDFQAHFTSLCTKYDPHIPQEVRDLRDSLSAFESRLVSLPSVSAIARLYKKGLSDISKLYSVAVAECRKILTDETVAEAEIPQRLKQLRQDTVSKVFDRRIILLDYSEQEMRSIAIDESDFAGAITQEFIARYMHLLKLATIQHIVDRETFLNLGLPFLERDPDSCPFCDQSLDKPKRDQIQTSHKTLKEKIAAQEVLQNQRAGILQELRDFRQRLGTHHARHKAKVTALLSLKGQEGMSQLRDLLAPKHEEHYLAVAAAIQAIEAEVTKLEAAHRKTADSLTTVIDSIDRSVEEAKLAEAVGIALLEYLAVARTFSEVISSHVPAMSRADQVLARELDVQAGTEDLSILIELMERRQEITKNFRVQAILGSLKDLRTAAGEYVADKLRDLVERQLTDDVMAWYEQIKTPGDPDVHFAGFDLPTTQKGTTKDRYIGVKATSYDVALASAVSSLSESKLNALGLCMNIANNLKGCSTFDFLVVDDPIQSLDRSHAAQLVSVIRKLVEEEGKQVILLSHDHEWLRTVRKECRTLNGYYYEITSYKRSGPVVSRCCWATTTERRDEIQAILKKADASATEKQRAAEEFRLAFNELTADIYRAKTGLPKNPDNLNGASIRALLIECDVPLAEVDKVTAAYANVAAAHHDSAYDASVEELRKYLNLADYMNTYLTNMRASTSLERAAERIRRI